jgi:hypothetical protein
MPTHARARQLAAEFENAYPDTLPERFAWWCRTLGIDRPRLLRMLGMSADEANSHKSSRWEAILDNKEWAENGWWVEGKLHELLALFDYDWRALAEWLHQTPQGDEEERARNARAPSLSLREPGSRSE